MSIIYDVIFVFFAVVYFPYLIIRKKWHPGFKARFGYFSPVLTKELDGKESIWVHAVSVGEVLAVVDLVAKLREEFPRYKIVCSTVTKTGQEIAREKLGGGCLVVYAPLDFSRVVRRFLRAINPKIYIAAETEIWPNLYTALHRAGVPVVQVNGRISDRSFRGYKKIWFLTKPILSCVNIFNVQSDLDAQRLRQLGAPPERVRVVGNLKFDNIPPRAGRSKNDLGFQDNEDLWIAGSTHPGEEGILIDVYARLVTEFTSLRLVIAPRHIERADEVIRLIESKGYKASRYSQGVGAGRDPKRIVVVDTIGHLKMLYGLATVVFIGKSLVVGGGQNVIEPACFGKPTIVGPLTQNFKDVVNIFLNEGALVQVNDKEELLRAVQELLVNPQRAVKIGEAAKQTVVKYQGATAKTLAAIKEVLRA
jgi:3-deoxy-D-manno-octulosonic-acid transferase